MKVHLVDGTYELFRQHFGMAVRHGDPAPNAAALGVVASTLQLVQQGATHLCIHGSVVGPELRQAEAYDLEAALRPPGNVASPPAMGPAQRPISLAS